MLAALDKKLNKICQDWFGLEGYDERVSKPEPEMADFSKLLIFESFDEENEVFHLKDKWLGCVFEVSPIVGMSEILDRNIAHFFADELPLNSCFQVTLVASHRVGPLLDYWAGARTSDNLAFSKITANRYEFLKQRAINFASSSPVRNFRIFISWIYQAPLVDFAVRKDRMFRKLESLDLLPAMVSPQELLNLTYEIVQPQKSIKQEAKRYDASTALNELCIFPLASPEVKETELLYKDSSLITKVFQVSEYPESFSLTAMIDLLGDGTRDSLSIPGRFVISFCVSAETREATNTIAKGTAVINSSEKPYSRHNITLQQEAVEWREVIAKLNRKNKILYTNFLVAITTEQKKIGEAESSLLSLYNINYWELRVAEYLQLPGLLALLPCHGGYYFSLFKKFHLTRTSLSDEILATLPLHAEWKGVASPNMILLGRRGQLINWDPYHVVATGNFNIVVMAPSGTGKSVLLQDLVTNSLAKGVRVFVLEIGLSFKNLCLLLGGEHIKFSPGMDISLNPFSKLSNDMDGEAFMEALGCIQAVLSAMCGASNKSEEAQLEMAIISTIEKYGRRGANITRLAEHLNLLGTPESRKMSLALFSYTAKGKYGKYFDRESNIYFNKALTVFEFEEIKNDKNLLSVVLQVIGMEVFLQVLSGDRQSNFMLVVDEAWMILDHAAKFLDELARTMRKYGGSLVVCVQGLADFDGSKERRSIFENSTWKLFLAQEPNPEVFEKFGLGRIIPLVRSVQFRKGKYAECLIYTTGIEVVGRIVLDPYSLALFNTNKESFNFISKRLAQGQSVDNIADELVLATSDGKVA